ncbi:GPI-anchor transamidase subunit U, partial [Lecanoromycetidae sp. Uapishka_2]
MAIDRGKALLYGFAAALRLLLFFAFPSLPDLLTGRVEISTPVTSFKRCIFAIFKPYPSISDTSLYFAMLPLYRHIFPLMRYTFFALATVLYATLLGPAFYYLWIYAGSGNANFFYAITLVWSLGLSEIVADSLFAVLRDEWEVERPEMKGKDVRQI